ncbi:hypothetical protein JXM83_06785 [Candidatus Woesearchaeota archaeon]|nr:hypothetical protein [Candidatus Woesearchaeota archaeon]
MNTLKIIKDQIDEALKTQSSLIGLNSVLTHIERAEYLLNNAQTLEDEHFYTDVIYRTNHAFEGILKEAYQVLADEISENKTPYDIENFLLDNNILNERVIELLKNYRQKWRNPSTHDYNLFFDYSEAFLAIISISAFVHVLMNQILEKIFYHKEMESLSEELTKIDKKIAKEYPNLNFVNKVKTILLGFTKRNYSKDIELVRRGFFEAEILGSLKAYFEAIDKKIKVDLESIIETSDRKLRPDLIVMNSKEKILIELKVLRRERSIVLSRRMFEDQLISYLVFSKIKTGILFVLPNIMLEDDEYTVETKEIEVGKENIKLIFIRLDESSMEKTIEDKHKLKTGQLL